jgi:molecular chaperone DnaK
MATGNKTLGRFELVGIPPAPRGVPQIEVTFDIDANGIVNVSAKDTATGKEQSIQITASSGLTKEEIDSAIKDAELHSEDDKKKKDLIDARNHADSLMYATEKSLKDLGEKVDAETRGKVEAAMGDLKQVIDGEDVEAIKAKSEALTQASHKLAEAMYQKSAQEGQGAEAGGQAAGEDASNADDDVVDADFEEVKDEDKK